MTDPAPPTDAAPASPRPRRRLSTQKKLSFMLVAVLGALCAGELSLRALGFPKGIVRTFSRLWTRPSDAPLPGLFRPGEHKIAYPTHLAYEVKINALGLRGPELSLEKTPGRLRILALGDSVTFGYHVSNDETWPVYLEAALKEAGRNVEVLNGGCGHFSIPDERAYLEERLLKLEPDVVALQFCTNDVTEREMTHELYRNIASGKASKSNWLRRTALGEAQLLLAIKIKEWARRRKGNWPPKGFPEPGEGGPAVQEKHWERYETELKAIKAALDAKGIPLVLTAFADLHEVEEKGDSPYEVRLRAICGRLKIPFKGAWTAYRAEADPKTLYHWPYDAHPKAKGNRALAGVVASLLNEAGVLNSSKPSKD